MKDITSIKNIFSILREYFHVRKIYGSLPETELFKGKTVVFNTVRVNPFQFGLIKNWATG